MKERSREGRGREREGRRHLYSICMPAQASFIRLTRKVILSEYLKDIMDIIYRIRSQCFSGKTKEHD